LIICTAASNPVFRAGAKVVHSIELSPFLLVRVLNGLRVPHNRGVVAIDRWVGVLAWYERLSLGGNHSHKEYSIRTNVEEG